MHDASRSNTLPKTELYPTHNKPVVMKECTFCLLQWEHILYTRIHINTQPYYVLLFNVIQAMWLKNIGPRLELERILLDYFTTSYLVFDWVHFEKYINKVHVDQGHTTNNLQWSTPSYCNMGHITWADYYYYAMYLRMKYKPTHYYQD